MRIALITDSYLPARTSVAVQIRDLARELRAQGHEPTVMVPSSSLPQSWSVEHLDGIEVLRLKAFRTKDVGYLRRSVAELSLSRVMLWGLSRSPLAEAEWDGIAWYSPTIFFGPFVKTLKKRSRCRAYLILRDLFPDWAVDVGVLRRGITYSYLKLVERNQYLAADVIGVQTPASLAHIDHLKATNSEQIVEVLNNWLSPTLVPSTKSFPELDALRGKTILVYAGNMGVAQGMDCLITLAESQRENEAAVFLFVGRGSEMQRLRQLCVTKSLHNVLFHDEVEPGDLPALLSRCHIGLLSLDARHKTHNVPGKFLTYLQAGIPVLACVNAGNDLVEVIESQAIGRVCVGNADDRLRKMAEELIAAPQVRREMGERGRTLATKMFSSVTAASQIIQALT